MLTERTSGGELGLTSQEGDKTDVSQEEEASLKTSTMCRRERRLSGLRYSLRKEKFLSVWHVSRRRKVAYSGALVGGVDLT